MTIDEGIRYCEETAHNNEILMNRYDSASGYSRSHNEDIRTEGAKGCERLMIFHRQLADWLRELKAYREAEDNIKHKAESGQWSDAVVYGMVKAQQIIKTTKFAHAIKSSEEGEKNDE